MRHAYLGLAAVLAVGIPTSASSDVITLKNGSVERGVIITESDAGYWLRSGPGMKMLYTRDEVAQVQRESEDVNAALQSRWSASQRTAAPAKAATQPASGQARPASQAAKSDLLTGLEPGEVVPKRQRYGFISGGGFQAGTTTQRDVREKLGDPDERESADDGSQTWLYDCGGGDGYVLIFSKLDGKLLLTDSYFESNYKDRAKERENEQLWAASHGH